MSNHVVFFRHRNEDSSSEITAFEDAILLFLREIDCDSILVLPHLYDLRADQDVVEDMCALQGELYVVSWLSSRAAFWLLRKFGLKQEIRQCLDVLPLYELCEYDSCENAERREALKTRFFSLFTPERNTVSAPVRHINLPSLRRRWYPVVDRDACIGCLECVNYCLFGVYDIGSGDLPDVTQPDACRDGCPACSRVCPARAIMFPEYEDPIISGRQSCENVRDTPGADPLDDLIDAVDEGLD